MLRIILNKISCKFYGKKYVILLEKDEFACLSYEILIQ